MTSQRRAYAHWKFVLGDKLIYKASIVGGIKWFLHARDKQIFDVYIKQTNEWVYQFTNIPQDYCNCGRLYIDSPDGTEFKWQSVLYAPKATLKEAVQAIQSPIMCIMCYYSKEHAAGRFCPRWVLERLES